MIKSLDNLIINQLAVTYGRNIILINCPIEHVCNAIHTDARRIENSLVFKFQICFLQIIINLYACKNIIKEANVVRFKYSTKRSSKEPQIC